MTRQMSKLDTLATAAKNGTGRKTAAADLCFHANGDFRGSHNGLTCYAIRFARRECDGAWFVSELLPEYGTFSRWEPCANPCDDSGTIPTRESVRGTLRFSSINAKRIRLGWGPSFETLSARGAVSVKSGLSAQEAAHAAHEAKFRPIRAALAAIKAEVDAIRDAYDDARDAVETSEEIAQVRAAFADRLARCSYLRLIEDEIHRTHKVPVGWEDGSYEARL